MAASTHDNPDVSIEKPRPTLEELKERKRKSRQPVGGCRETITVSMGPQHPSTHGVFRAELDLDGEIIVNARPEIGNLHRAVEKLMGVEGPPRARYIRTLAHELTRIANHLLWLGVHVMDLGAQTFFLITFRDREYILDLFEMLCGARLTHSYARIGGVSKDLPEDFDRRCREVVDFMPKRLVEYENLIKSNRIFLKRTVGVGIFTSEDCATWRITGPSLRAAGVERDLRKDEPYAAYDEVDFEVAVEYNADVYDRFLVRMKEVRESCSIVRQCLDKMPEGEYLARDAAHVLPLKKNVMSDAASMVQDFVHVFHGPRIPEGEVYRAVEVPKGEMGVYISSDGGPKPQRLHLATPTFYHCQAVPPLFEGETLADSVGIFGSVDVVLGAVSYTHLTLPTIY